MRTQPRDLLDVGSITREESGKIGRGDLGVVERSEFDLQTVLLCFDSIGAQYEDLHFSSPGSPRRNRLGQSALMYWPSTDCARSHEKGRGAANALIYERIKDYGMRVAISQFAGDGRRVSAS